MALEGVLSSVAGEILNLLGSQASQCFGMLWGLNDDLHKLKSNVSSIQAVLCDAEERQIKGNNAHSLNDWLEKLGDVFYDAEDVLDEISTEVLRRKVMMRGKNAKQVRIFFSNSNQLAFNYKMACQVKNINERLDVISQEKDKFRFNVNFESRIPHDLSHPIGIGRETHSSLSGEKVIGRDDDMNNLKKNLLEEDEQVKPNVSFIAIVGTGGIGKTTLAKALYNDKDVLDCFYPRIWIWVSDQFDINTILKKIIESATRMKPEVDGTEALKTKLQTVIEGKKYLLVMDDVWNENEDDWESLKNLLMLGARGSKVLITKRNSKVVFPEVETVPLKDLPEDPSWLLFKEVAFKEVAFKENGLESTNQNLVQLGKEISKKCGGSPLVIRHIGRLLYGKTSVEDWKFIKDNELLNVTREQNNNDGHVISTLKLSYNHLSPNLKRCFAYTSLFPKGYKISSNELIRQWIAQGFIESSHGGKSMEDIGKDYLNELCWRFFCEISSENRIDQDNVSMHDMMRDLARKVAGKKLYVRGDLKKEYVVSEQTRHISFDYEIKSWDEDVLSKLCQAKGLRTFLLFTESPIEEVVLDKLFWSFPRLRVLQISKMSKSIKRLRHLRYLNLVGGFDEESVPNYITELQNLQTLDLTDCFDLKEWRMDIRNLVNLRHLLLFPDIESFHTPEGLEKLSYLQTLSLFVFDCKNFNKRRQWEEFNELKCYIISLRIIGLEQLRSGTDPSKLNLLNLKNKKGIKCLIAEWELGNNNNEEEEYELVDETILEGLEPHPDVKELRIIGYCGVGLPNWVSTSPLNKLITIEIINCHRLQHLNQLSHLQALKSLYLLDLRSLMSLSEWIGSMSCVEFIFIVECRKLKSVPKEIQELKCLNEIFIINCPQLKERCKRGGEDWHNISNVPYFHYSDMDYSDYYNRIHTAPHHSSDNGDHGGEGNGKLKDCITNIRSFFLTCGYEHNVEGNG